MSRVAIVGAGPAGLVSAKECLDQGLDVTVFEKTGRIGGLWNAGSGVWPDMRTNLSKDSCAFPDFPWPDDAPLFPSQGDILKYLEAYKAHFNLEGRVRFHYETPVQKVSKNAHWEIETQGCVEMFDHVIVGSGFFSKPYIPEAQGIEDYQGNIIHSSELAPFAQFEGRNVVVVGNAFSGCDISVGLSKAGANVTQIYRRPVWILTRLLNGPNGQEALDSFFYRTSEPPKADMSLSEEYRALNDGMGHLCAAQNAEQDQLYVDPNSHHPPHVSVTDGYIEAVRSGAINLIQMQHLEMTANGFRGVDHAVDDVVFATGFETDLSFLSADVLDALNYQPQDRFLPLTTHECMWGEGLGDMALVGMYRGPFFLTMALQAKWVAQAFANPDQYAPKPDDVQKGVQTALEMRELPRHLKPQFPEGDYVSFVIRLAGQIGLDVEYDIGQRVLPSDYSKRSL